MELVTLGNGRWVHPSREVCAVQSAMLMGAPLPMEIKRERGTVLGPLTEEFVGALYLRGVDVSGLEPFHYRYQPPLVEGRYPPMPHQLATAAFLSVHRRAYCTSTMRTGKTAAVVMALDYLRRVKGEGGAALIVASLSVLDDIWLRTIQRTLPWASAGVVHGTMNARRNLLATQLQYYIINYEGLVRLQPELEELVRTGRITSLVFDELTHYGNADSQRWKAANALANGTRRENLRVWGLTGTPGGNSDAVYGYARLVHPEAMPWRRIASWKAATQERYGSLAWQWRDKAHAPEIVKQVLQPCIRFAKEQVLEHLPAVGYDRRRAELSNEQARAIEDLRRDFRTKMDDGTVFTVAQQAHLANRIFQLALGGGLYEDKGIQRFKRLDSTARLEALLEIIQESERKTVIFRSFTKPLEDLTLWLNQRGVPTAKVHGATGRLERARIFGAFQDKEELRVLVAHPQTVAYGVELAAADQLVFDGPPLSGVQNYLQALERPLSAKQTAERVTVVQLTATPEERRFFDALDGRRSYADSIAELFTFFIGKDAT